MDEPLSDEAIAQAFLTYLDETGVKGMKYGEFWRILIERGLVVPGRNGKVQRDRVWRALSKDRRIRRSAPGFFDRASLGS
jgi:hypothetical protein